MHSPFDTGTKAGTIGGTLLSTGMNVHLDDISKTVILAVVGAVVSFGVSLFLRWCVKRNRKKSAK